MTLTPSLPTGAASGLPASARRRIQAGMVAKSAAGVPRTGVLPAHTNPLVTGKASMGYDVAAFVAALSRQAGLVEFVANDAVYDLSPDGYGAPNANSRIDVIWARARLVAASDPVDVTEFGVSQGQANAIPQKPAIPPGAFEIATAVVESTDTTTQTVVITPTYQFTALEGGTVLLRNQDEQNAWAPHDGSSAFRLDTGTGSERIGGAWIPVSGVMPEIDLVSGATLSVPSGSSNVNVWSVPGTGESIARFDDSWFSYDAITGDVTVARAGRYQVAARLVVQSGSGTAAGYVIRGGSPTDILTQDSATPAVGFGAMLKLDVGSVTLAAGAKLRVWIPNVSAALNFGGPNGRRAGEFLIRYLGPA